MVVKKEEMQLTESREQTIIIWQIIGLDICKEDQDYNP